VVGAVKKSIPLTIFSSNFERQKISSAHGDREPAIVIFMMDKRGTVIDRAHIDRRSNVTKLASLGGLQDEKGPDLIAGEFRFKRASPAPGQTPNEPEAMVPPDLELGRRSQCEREERLLTSIITDVIHGRDPRKQAIGSNY
jgi:hypothetical protein